MSAFLSSDAGSSPSAGYVEMPMLAVTWILAAGQRIRPADRVQDVLRDGGELARIGAILDQHDELVAAEPRHGVALAQVMAQPPRDVLQQAVARLVAEAVVDVLEAVEVDEEERELLAAPLRERERALQRVHEHRAVGQVR